MDAAAIPDSAKRRLYGCVEQSFHAVPGTVLDQITLSDPAISRTQADQAADLAGLTDAIAALPQGFDTPMGEGLFSQGQLQLLSIARAVAANPPILLLDESTANLDSLTERRVLDALQKVSAGRTVLSISHRLGEVNADTRIIFIGEKA
jgi:ATP-binding cassette subfamily B protein